jgi:sugar lactone lactonase YvrE
MTKRLRGLLIGFVLASSGLAAPMAEAQIVNTVVTGLTNPSGIAMDSSGNIFVADATTAVVTEYMAPGYTVSHALGGADAGAIGQPFAIALDSSGNLFIADFANGSNAVGAVEEIPKAGGYASVTTLNQSFGSAVGIAVDASDNVFVTDTSDSSVNELTASSGYATVIPLGAANGNFSSPVGLAVDGSGNVFVADGGSNLVKEILKSGGYVTVNTLAPSATFTFPNSISLDLSGNLYVLSDHNPGAVTEILAPGYTTTSGIASSSTFDDPNDAVFDAKGNLFLTNSGAGKVEEILLGVTVSAVSPSSGVIAGGTTVTITGTNMDGATGVKFGTIAATNVSVTSDSSLTATSPAGTGTVDITVTTAVGTSATIAGDRFTYVPALSTTTSLSSSLNPATSPQNETFTATVTSTSTVNEGTVAFTSDSSGISGCSAQPVSSGAATCTTALPTGSHSVVATFNGTANFLTSPSSPLTELVNSAVTATTVISSKILVAGQSATSFTPVTGGGGTGTLTYTASLPTGLTIAPSTGAITGTPASAGGPSTITVMVTDTNLAHASNTFTLAVDNAVTATALVPPSKTVTIGQSSTNFPLVTPGGGTGSFSYSISPTTVPTGMSFSASTGRITLAPTAGATTGSTIYSVTVTDTDSVSTTANNVFTLTVEPAVTATALATPSKAVTIGQSSTTVPLVTPGGGTGSYSYSISPTTVPTGMSFSATTGDITGAPTAGAATGTTHYSVTVTDTDGGSATASNVFSLTVDAAVTATAIPASDTKTMTIGQPAGTAFSLVTPGGGNGSYSYSISPTLPTGLTFSAANGQVSSVPTTGAATGTATYSVTVTDGNGGSATASNVFSLTVEPAVTATALVPPSKAVTIGQSSTTVPLVTPGGGTGSFSYSIAPTTVPTGMSFSSSTGNITGAPTAGAATGTTPYTVTVTDTDGGTATNSFSLTVNGPVTATQSIATEVLTQNHMVTSFTPVTGGGGTPSLAYSISPGLPTGLMFSTTSGAITGNPSVTSTATPYMVTATDANGAVASNTFSLTVNTAVTATQAVASEALTQNRVATSFTPVTGGGGTGALTYTASLPTGLTIDSSTGAITGTPASAGGPSTITVMVTDTNSATATASFSLTVNTVVTATQSIPTEALTENHAATSFTPVTGGGGTIPLAYSIAPPLPTDLGLSTTTGAITGTPNVTSAATGYTVTVTDANGATATNSFSLTIAGPVTATQAVASKGLTISFAATPFTPVMGGGGVGTLTYSVSPLLSSGLAMSPGTGQITGTPSVASAATPYMVTVTDQNSATATASFSLTVNGAVTASPAVASTTLTQNHATAAFTPVTGGGGTTPLSYNVAPPLPAGLTMGSATGAITGTPTVTSALTGYMVTVTDLNGATATAGFNLMVNQQVTATQAVAMTSLKVNQAAAAFTPVTGGGGTGALTYSISPGLPTGLGMASTTGTISGTPSVTEAATSYTVTVTDTNGATATAGFSLAVTTTASSVTVASSLNPSTYGQSVTFKAIVGGTGATPTGTVTFKDGGTTLVTLTLANALSSYTTSTLSPGPHTINVAYSGDSIFAGSSGAVTELVDGPPTTPGQTYPYKGTLPGFVGPGEGLYDDVNDHILIADAGNQRVQVLSAQTLAAVAILGTTGVAGSDNAHFNDPTGVAFDAGTDQIFVSDTGNDRIQVFNAATFAYVETIGVTGGSSARPEAAGETSFNAPGGMHVNAATGQLYVADTGNQRVQIFSTSTMAYVATLGMSGAAGSDNAHFNAPKDAVVNAATNEILVADSGNSRVQRFDATSLAYKGTIGGAGLGVGNSDYVGSPSALAYDAMSNLVLIADPAEQRVEVFDALSYTYVLTLGTTGSAGSGNNQFSGPAGVAIDTVHEQVLISDQQNKRVQIFAIKPAVAFASILPGSRSVELGHPATIFASMINAGTTALQGCQVALPVTAPSGLSLSYQTTDPATNTLIGSADTPATISGNNGVQSFLVTLQGTSAFSAPGMALDFVCLGAAPATVETGVDTVDLVLSSTPVADVIALAATASNNGIVEVPTGGAGAFAIASTNVGATSQIIVSVDTGAAALPLTATLCQSNPATGACLATPAGSVTLSDAAGAAPTFSVFLEPSGTIPFAPAANRVFVRFKDPGGGLHGSTSVAVETN